MTRLLLSSLHSPPPRPLAELSLKVQPINVALVPMSLYTPPPRYAPECPVNVQLNLRLEWILGSFEGCVE